MKLTELALSKHQDAQRSLVAQLTTEGWTFPAEEHWQPEAIVVSRDTVMSSNAGYYIGQHCYEFTDYGDESIPPAWSGPMPYSRDTEYMSREEAQTLLEIQRLVAPKTVMPSGLV